MNSPAPDGRSEVDACVASVAQPMREQLLRLRALVHGVASGLPGVAPLVESLKWGQPSFTPKRANVGSSVRLAALPDGRVGVYFICHTGLVDRFRELYPEGLEFEGNRAILVTPGSDVDRDALSHCIAMALTYHLDKRAAPAQRTA
jgi:hypothetical protein